jgi:hypothetical protein
LCDFSLDLPGDQVSADNEEDIDANIPAKRTMKSGVEEYDPENGYGSENVDVWSVFQETPLRTSV